MAVAQKHLMCHKHKKTKKIYKLHISYLVRKDNKQIQATQKYLCPNQFFTQKFVTVNCLVET
jgi:hypothetical protein